MEAAPRRLNITATTTIKSASKLAGVLVGPATGTIKVADTQGTILNTISPVAGQYLAMPCHLSGDLVLTITGAVDCTVFYE